MGNYVYDTETGLYYLQSRYYNPTIGRFINADVLISTGQGLLGNNNFAYCRNNPVCRIDITGYLDASCIDDENDKDLFPDDDIGHVDNGSSNGGGSNTSSIQLVAGSSGQFGFGTGQPELWGFATCRVFYIFFKERIIYPLSNVSCMVSLGNYIIDYEFVDNRKYKLIISYQ